MSSPIHKVADPIMPPTPANTTRLAVLQTRCLAQRVIEVPINETPQQVTIELVPLRGQQGKEERVFYLAGEGTVAEGTEPVLVYREGPAKEQGRIIVPELPKKLVI